MSIEVSLSKYIPTVAELNPTTVAEVIDRCRSFLASEYPELNTAPNSVFGEFFLKPLAMLIAAYEQGATKFLADFDLDNLATGAVNDCDIANMILANYGLQPTYSTPTIGTIRINFSENKQYILDIGSRVLFNTTDVFTIVTTASGTNIIIDPIGTLPKPGNHYVLKQTDADTYSVDMTVTGQPAAVVSANATADTDIPDLEIRNIVALDDFLEGTLPTSIKDLAKLASKIFTSAALTTRGGAISFLLRQFPHLKFVSPVISGDIEMRRDKYNFLGFSDGRLDIYAKQNATLLVDKVLVNLVSDGTYYSGKLNTLEIPAYIDGIKLAEGDATYLDESDYIVVGRSTDSVKANRLSAAYSTTEELGLKILPSALTTLTAQDAVSTPLVNNVTITGDYISDAFSETPSRNIKIVLEEYAAQVITATIIDTITGRTGVASFDTTTPFGSICTATLNYNSSDENVQLMTRGISIIITNVNIVNLKPSVTILNASLTTYTGIRYGAPYKTVLVYYRTDPVISQISDIIESPDVQPAIDTIVKNCITIYVKQLKVNYRRLAGTYVDRDLARTEIFNYVNSVGYPEAYEQSAIIDIMLYAGANGVASIEEQVRIYPSLASEYYVGLAYNPANLIYDTANEAAYENLELNSLTVGAIPTTVNVALNLIDSHIGVKNVHYILDIDNIIINEIKY